MLGTWYEYYVEAVDDAGNVSKPSDTLWISTLSVGVENNPDSKQFISVYPNPAEEELFILLSNVGNREVYFELYSVNGTVVKWERFRQNGNQSQFRVDLTGLSGGLYVYRVLGKEIFTTGRIQIQK
jgi:hypothetical protein